MIKGLRVGCPWWGKFCSLGGRLKFCRARSANLCFSSRGDHFPLTICTQGSGFIRIPPNSPESDMIRSQRNTVVLLGVWDEEEVKRLLRLGLLYWVYSKDSLWIIRRWWWSLLGCVYLLHGPAQACFLNYLLPFPCTLIKVLRTISSVLYMRLR